MSHAAEIEQRMESYFSVSSRVFHFLYPQYRQKLQYGIRGSVISPARWFAAKHALASRSIPLLLSGALDNL